MYKQTPVLSSFSSTCHVGTGFDPLAKEQRLHTLGHGDDDVGPAHRLLHRGTHRHRAAHHLAEPLRPLPGVVPHSHLWREPRRHYASILPWQSLPQKNVAGEKSWGIVNKKCSVAVLEIDGKEFEFTSWEMKWLYTLATVKDGANEAGNFNLSGSYFSLRTSQRKMFCA